MIDIKIIRENPKKFKDAAAAKGFDVDIDRYDDLANGQNGIAGKIAFCNIFQ